MSENLALLSDGNSPLARRARVKLQPRDRKGRWIPTGASLFAMIRGLGGSGVKKYNLKAIGGTATKKGEKNKIRALLTSDAPDLGLRKNTVVEIDPANGELDTQIKLDRDFLERKGIDPDLQHTLPSTLGEKFDKVEDINPKPADDLDIELANEGLTDEEDKDFRAERDQEPLAKLPPGMEELDKDELDSLTRGGPKAPSDVKKPARDPRKSDVPEPTDVSDKPKPPTLQDSIDRMLNPSQEDKAVDDAIGEAFYGGEVPTLDQLVDKAKAPAPKTAAPNTKVGDLKAGDIVQFRGQDLPIKSVKQRSNGNYDVIADANGRDVNLALTQVNGQTPFSSGFPENTQFIKTGSVQAPKPSPATKSAPKAKSAPDAAPEAPATPKKVAKPAAKPAANKPKASTPKKPPTIPAGRKDDGKDIAPSGRPLGDMQAVKIANQIDPVTGKPLKVNRKNVEDPNALYDALLEMNPDAKVDKSGHIILERQDFTDKDGKVYKYEVAVAKTHNNKYIERYKFTDDKGDTQTFYHYDYKDSFASIYGDKNGVYTFRDHILGRTSPEAPTRANGDENRVYKAYWGDDKGLEARLRYFRGGRAKGSEPPTDEELTATQAKAIKMLTPEELVRKYLTGNAEKHNKSGNARGTKLQSFVGSSWEAIEQDDMPTFEARLQQVLGRLPDDEDSRNLLMNTLRDGIKEKFNGTPQGRKLAPLANNLEKKILTEGLDIRDLERRPFASKDGKTIVNRGDKVRYWNNVGDWSIGEALAQMPPRAGSGGKNVYDDVVAVKFGDGSIHLLRSNRMDILGDDLDNDLNLHDKDSDSTDFKPNLSGQPLRDARGYSFNFGDEENQAQENADLQPDEVGSTADQDAAAPYLGEQGVDADEAPDAAEPDSVEGNIGDFEAGDVWPDENGDRIGTFVEAVKVSDDVTGREAWAVYWMDDDGDEQLEFVELDSSRVPK